MALMMPFAQSMNPCFCFVEALLNRQVFICERHHGLPHGGHSSADAVYLTGKRGPMAVVFKIEEGTQLSLSQVSQMILVKKWLEMRQNSIFRHHYCLPII